MTPRPGIEDYYATLVRLIASQMVDPHRAFEQKLVGEMQAAADTGERGALLLRLLRWLDDGLLTPAQLERVDARLDTAGLPKTGQLLRSSEALLRLDAGR